MTYPIGQSSLGLLVHSGLEALTVPGADLNTAGLSLHTVYGEIPEPLSGKRQQQLWNLRTNPNDDALGVTYTISVDGTEVASHTGTNSNPLFICAFLVSKFNSSTDPAKDDLVAVAAHTSYGIMIYSDVRDVYKTVSGSVDNDNTWVITERDYGLNYVSTQMLRWCYGTNAARFKVRLELFEVGGDTLTFVDPLTTALKEKIIEGCNLSQYSTLALWTDPEDSVTRISDSVVEVVLEPTTQSTSWTVTNLGWTIDKDCYLVNGSPATASARLLNDIIVDDNDGATVGATSTGRHWWDATVYNTGSQSTSTNIVTGGTAIDPEFTTIGPPWVQLIVAMNVLPNPASDNDYLNDWLPRPIWVPQVDTDLFIQITTSNTNWNGDPSPDNLIWKQVNTTPRMFAKRDSIPEDDNTPMRFLLYIEGYGPDEFPNGEQHMFYAVNSNP